MQQHKRCISSAYSVEVWAALQDVADRHYLLSMKISHMDIGQYTVGVIPYDNDRDAVFAGRVSWYKEGGYRVITDVSCFIWNGHETDPLLCTYRHKSLRLSESKGGYLCDTPRQARALAAVASEAGNLPGIEPLIDHER